MCSFTHNFLYTLHSVCVFLFPCKYWQIHSSWNFRHRWQVCMCNSLHAEIDMGQNVPVPNWGCNGRGHSWSKESTKSLWNKSVCVCGCVDINICFCFDIWCHSKCHVQFKLCFCHILPSRSFFFNRMESGGRSKAALNLGAFKMSVRSNSLWQ